MSISSECYEGQVGYGLPDDDLYARDTRRADWASGIMLLPYELPGLIFTPDDAKAGYELLAGNSITPDIDRTIREFDVLATLLAPMTSQRAGVFLTLAEFDPESLAAYKALSAEFKSVPATGLVNNYDNLYYRLARAREVLAREKPAKFLLSIVRQVEHRLNINHSGDGR